MLPDLAPLFALIGCLGLAFAAAGLVSDWLFGPDETQQRIDRRVADFRRHQ